MKKLFLFVLLLGVWILLTLPLDIQNVVLGVIVAFIVVLIFGKWFPKVKLKKFTPYRIFWALYYIPHFLYYMFMSNLDVMYRVLHPARPIKPGIVKVKTRLKTPFARMLLCNSITLTPGTLTIDIIGEDIYVHWINVKSDDVQKATDIIVRRFEKIIERVFE